MRFFALETDKEKIFRRFCSESEQIVLMTYYHGLSFLFASFRDIVATVVLFSAGIFAWWMQWPMEWVILSFAVIWFGFVFFSMIKSYIDWCFDYILVTTDKIILTDQTSFWKQEVNPIHIENVGAVSTRTQFWGIFNFGIVILHLKEGLGGDKIVLKYVPNATEVAAKIADVVTRYQRKASH
ncbi:TPA: hypothetical protein DCL30_01930 [Candidatus Peribacteria bacterium]|nr:MAG: hypothetical protein A3J91_03625 [Candidatus Peribacteria bacterium RIFOXYC2_FULL_58_10]OGJ85270.1 MAG: hypothetical protein A2529_02290 [Candidatus Peribacteria bacterium RIFOXYD2_FULL_58_15]HAI98285.1 hypothetical protein [Candidatus Peribacteria bacterium]HAS33966.1 hypothetical protein [Candidatus Peribacteria bacterium]